jgi:hypothetical protein
MKLNIENFETMTPGYSVSNILSDISTNHLSNSKVDEINANIKGQLDNLLKQIQDKQKTINTLQKKINKEAIGATKKLNDKLNYSGKNIYFNNLKNIDVYSFLNPVAIIPSYQYLELEVLKQITTPVSSGFAEELIGAVDAVSQEGFERALFSIGEQEQVLQMNKDNSYYITIPLRGGAGTLMPSLLTTMQDAAFRKYTNKNPNFNNQFLFGRKLVGIPGFSTKLVDFNLSYTNQLPAYLASSNFLSVGYNGHIYVGIGVTAIPLGGSSSFLTELINNHFGHNSSLPQRDENSSCSADFGSGIPTAAGGGGDYPGHVNACPQNYPVCKDYVPNVHYGKCYQAGSGKGKIGFFMNSQFYGNQADNQRGDALKNMATVAEGNAEWLESMAQFWHNTGHFDLEFISDVDANVWENQAKIDRAGINATNTMQSEMVFLGMLTDNNNQIIGPNIDNIQNTFLDGGIKSAYLGCFKDKPQRVLPEYRGVVTPEECQKIAHSEGAVLYGMQDGGPGGVGRQNYTNGQCWIGDKSLNQYPPCLTAGELLGEAVINLAELELGGQATEKGQQWPAMCPTNNCKGNPEIGGPWANAVYLANAAPPVLGCQLILVGFGSGDVAGTLKYVYREGDQQRTVNLWQPQNPVDQSLLLPYTPENTGDPNTGKDGITSVNNFEAGPQKGQTLNFIWGGSGTNKYLYSNDYYFRLELNSELTGIGGKKGGFMNSSNSFQAGNNSQSNYNNLFNFKTTGIKCIVNTDIRSWSGANINSKDPRISKLFNLLNSVDPLRDLGSSTGNYSIVYSMRPIENKYLGRMGFIEYSTDQNSAKTPYNIKLYPENKLYYKTKGPAKFIETPGTLDPSKLPGWAKEMGISITEIGGKYGSTADNEMNCAKACYNDLQGCHGYDYTENKQCFLFNGADGGTKTLLEAQAVNAIFGPNLTSNKFNLRVPDIDNADTCPNTVKDPLITSAIPDLTDTKPSSTVTYRDINTKLYYNLEETNDLSLCNVGRIINNDELLLKSLQDELTTLADKYDTLVTNLEGKEKAIYQKLISKDKLLTTEMNKLKNIEQEIDSQQGDVPETLSQQIEDSTFNLINDNYNFILWTILAIGIIIAAIHFGRKIKK